MPKRFIKIIAITIVPVMLWLLVDIAFAYFNDPANIASAGLQVATLSLQIAETNNFDQPLRFRTTASQIVTVSPTSTLETQYQLAAASATGGLCDSLVMTVKLNTGAPLYDGIIANLNLPARLISQTDYWTLDYYIDNPGQNLQGLSCEFNLIFQAWQADIPNWNTGGFSHVAKIHNIINTQEQQQPEHGDVVFSEFMWMGSSVSRDDEWIELQNTTDAPINIGGWTIEHVLDKSNALLEILPNVIIPPHGFYLISQKHPDDNFSALNVMPQIIRPDLNLFNDDNKHPKLRDKKDLLIDHAHANNWPAGINGETKHSMQRLSPPENGMDPHQWSSCVDEACNDTRYWDIEGNDYGTPAGPNIFGQEIEGRGNVTIIDTILTSTIDESAPINASSTAIITE